METDDTVVKQDAEDVTGVDDPTSQQDTSQSDASGTDSGDIDDLDADALFGDLDNIEAPEDDAADASDASTDDATDAASTSQANDKTSDATSDQATASDSSQGARDARLEQLQREVDEYKKRIGDAPNADVRVAVKERNLAREMAENSIRAQQLQTERDLLAMVNPETGENYTPQEANVMAQLEANAAQAANLQDEQRDLVIQQNQGTMRSEIASAMRDLPIFQPKNTDGSPNPLFKAAANLAGQYLWDAYITEPRVDKDGNAVLGPNGQPQMVITGIKRSPAEILKSVATTLEATRATGVTSGQTQAATTTAQQRVNADVPLHSSTTASRKDPDFEDFDAMMDDDL